jgi:hypothetical protein
MVLNLGTTVNDLRMEFNRHIVRDDRGETIMPDWLMLPVVLAIYVVLMRWVLPRFGVPT